MKRKTVIKYYADKYGEDQAVNRIAKELKCTTKAIYKWGELVPLVAAAKLEVLSNGSLKIDPIDYWVERGEMSSKTSKY